MAKKAKKKLHPMPKLGFRDQLIYIIAMILTMGGALAVMILQMILQDRITFADPEVVAYRAGRGYGNMMFLFFWLFFVGIIIFAGPYQSRLPIFGIRGFKYGPPAYPRTYPLLMKNKPKSWSSPKKQAAQRKERNIVAAFLLVTLVFSLAMFPRSLYGREVLMEDGTITVYSPGNREAEHYKFSDVESVTLETYKYTPSKSLPQWSIRMVIHTRDGEDFYFTCGSFKGTYSESLTLMTEMKTRYGGLVTIEGTNNLGKSAGDMNLNPEERALLYALFEVPY